MGREKGSGFGLNCVNCVRVTNKKWQDGDGSVREPVDNMEQQNKTRKRKIRSTFCWLAVCESLSFFALTMCAVNLCPIE